MRIRSTLVGAIAMAGLAAAPRSAHADTVNITDCSRSPNIFHATLGIGGTFTGCFVGTVGRLGEDAFLNSTAYFFSSVDANNPLAPARATSGGYINAPVAPGQTLFTTNCGSGGNGVFFFCDGTHAALTTPDNNTAQTQGISNSGGEGVFALQTPDPVPVPGFSGYYSYTGVAGRNANPAPPGLQAVLLQVQVGGVDDTGHFVLGWEDLNTGCNSDNSMITTIDASHLGDGAYLNGYLAQCGSFTDPANHGNSDSDYNDIYFDIHLASIGIPTENPTPEPMTMSMMAFGLVAMGGASFRRRKNSK
jgi:hypothetical protein